MDMVMTVSQMRCLPVPAPVWAGPEAASLVGAADVLYVCVRIVRPHQVQPLLVEGCLRDRAEDMSVPNSLHMLSHATQHFPLCQPQQWWAYDGRGCREWKEGYQLPPSP